MEKRRHIPSNRHSAKQPGGFGTAVVVIVSLILIAAIVVLSPIGNYLLENVFTPVYSCVTGENEDQEIVSALKQQDAQRTPVPTAIPTVKAHEVISIEETPFYILQMGAFTDESAANEHAEEIRRLGAAGVVYTEGSVFRVFAAAYTDETSLVRVQSQVRADGFEATPYITEKKALKLTADGDAEAVQIVRDAVQLMNEVPKQLCEISLSYDKNERDAAQTIKGIRELRDQSSECIEALAQIADESVQPIKALIGKYEEKLSTFLKEHDTMDTEMLSGELKQLQLSAIIDYILFFEKK